MELLQITEVVYLTTRQMEDKARMDSLAKQIPLNSLRIQEVYLVEEAIVCFYRYRYLMISRVLFGYVLEFKDRFSLPLHLTH